MNPHFHTDFSISDSLIFVRKSVLIYETIILVALTIMIAESKPDEKEMMISVIMNCICG